MNIKDEPPESSRSVLPPQQYASEIYCDAGIRIFNNTLQEASRKIFSHMWDKVAKLCLVKAKHSRPSCVLLIVIFSMNDSPEWKNINHVSSLEQIYMLHLFRQITTDINLPCWVLWSILIFDRDLSTETRVTRWTLDHRTAMEFYFSCRRIMFLYFLNERGVHESWKGNQVFLLLRYLSLHFALIEILCICFGVTHVLLV